MRRSAFTLIELLVVISIIALLIALLLPAIKQARETGKLAACLSNQKQIGIGVHSYANDNGGFFPVPPLDEFVSSGFDIGAYYMSSLIGGDDISPPGGWPITTMMPADRRPMATYISPTSEAWRCPGDEFPLPWYYGTPAWDAGTSSYNFNAGGGMDVTGVSEGLFNATLDMIEQPATMVMLGDWAWESTRPNLPDNDFVMFTTVEDCWWHPRGFEDGFVGLSFVDGHATYTPIQIRVPNTTEYHRDQ